MPVETIRIFVLKTSDFLYLLFVFHTMKTLISGPMVKATLDYEPHEMMKKNFISQIAQFAMQMH